MEMVPASLVRAARDWDEQQHDVAAAAAALEGVDTSGFPHPAAGAADAFLNSWTRLTGALAARAGATAEGLRTTAADWVATDRGSADDVAALAPYPGDRR